MGAPAHRHGARLLAGCAVALGALFAGAAADAADFALADQPGALGCTFVMSGPLAAGDTARFDAFVEAQGWQPELYGTRRLCLDSPGGSFAEALDLADRIPALGLGTGVGDGATCESACALVFMSGQRLGEENINISDRLLHPRGRLGFHAPALVSAERSYEKAEIDAAYRVALDSIRHLLTLRSTRELAFAESLLLAMLATPPDEMLYVDTVGQAASWRIPVSPVGLPEAPRDALVEAACTNAQSQHYGRPLAAGLGSATALVTGAIEAPDGRVRATTVPAFLGEGAYECTVSVNPDGAARALGDVSFGAGGFLEALTVLHAYMLHPAETALADLPLASQPVNAPLRRILLQSDNRPFAPSGAESCWLPGPVARVSEVQEFVNLRAATGFSADVLREVPLGEALTLVGNPIVEGDAAQRQRCATACRRMAADPSEAFATEVRRCIGDNAVWYQVRDRSGATGYVSRKFLSDG